MIASTRIYLKLVTPEFVKSQNAQSFIEKYSDVWSVVCEHKDLHKTFLICKKKVFLFQKIFRRVECWLHPRGDDQQQANVPRQALPRSDLKDSRGFHFF